LWTDLPLRKKSGVRQEAAPIVAVWYFHGCDIVKRASGNGGRQHTDKKGIISDTYAPQLSKNYLEKTAFLL